MALATDITKLSVKLEVDVSTLATALRRLRCVNRSGVPMTSARIRRITRDLELVKIPDEDEDNAGN